MVLRIQDLLKRNLFINTFNKIAFALVFFCILLLSVNFPVKLPLLTAAHLLTWSQMFKDGAGSFFQPIKCTANVILSASIK